MLVVTEGVVVEGDHRGRELGYPTANVDIGPDVELPDDGVYAGTAERADHTIYAAAISVGHRPTFYGEEAPRLLEAFLLDFDGDLYGEHLKITITALVRGQAHFASREQLVSQIAADVEQVRTLVSASPPQAG